jgi:hypothetical protein
VVASIAEPASVGLSSLAGLLAPVGRHDPGGVFVAVAGPDQEAVRVVRAPLAPGTFVDVPVASVRRLAEGDVVTLHGPGVLSFDGERDRVLSPRATARISVRRAGPHVVDVDRTLRAAAAAGCFERT